MASQYADNGRCEQRKSFFFLVQFYFIVQKKGGGGVVKKNAMEMVQGVMRAVG